MLKSCCGFQWFHLLWTLPPTSVEGGLYPEESPENWNKSFSEIIQSILPPTPNYTSLYSQAMVIHSHSWLHTMETSKKPGGTIWDIWDSLPRKPKKPPKTTTADKTVSSLLHVERDFQNLQTPTFSFQGKSQFEKFTLFCFHFVVFCWLIFFFFTIYTMEDFDFFFLIFFFWPVQLMNSSWHL